MVLVALVSSKIIYRELLWCFHIAGDDKERGETDDISYFVTEMKLDPLFLMSKKYPV